MINPVEHLANRVANNRLFVYQMGKVGSTSIETSLKVLNIDSIHRHTYRRITAMTELHQKYDTLRLARKNRHNSIHKRIKKVIFNYLMVKHFRSKKNISKVITLVREPIARNISMYFQNFYIPCLEIAVRGSSRTTDNTSINAFIEDFFNKYNHYYGIKWFDNEFLKVTGVDIYDYPFDKEKGYCVINDKGVSVLIMQMEKMNDLEKVMGEFVGNDEFKLINDNTSDEKWYSCVYKKFKETIEIPENYIDNIYNTKFMKHFYSDDDISSFRNKYKNG